MAMETGAVSAITAMEHNTNTWNGTAIACGADSELRITSEGVAGGKAALERATLGKPHGDKPDVGPEGHRGPITFDVFYGGRSGKFLSYIMGSDGTAAGGGTTQTHISDFSDSLTRLFTFVIRKRSGAIPWEYATAKMAQLILRVGGDGQVEAEASIISSALARASTINNTTTITTVSLVTNTTTGQSTAILGRALLTDGVFRLNAQAGGALAASDGICIRDFTATFVRPLDETFMACATPSGMAEPFEDGFNLSTFGFSLRSYDQETFEDAWAAGTEYKCDLTFTGPAGSTATNMTHLFEFPRAVVMEKPQAPVSGPNFIPHDVTLKLLEATAAPTGMSGTKPCRYTCIDQDATDYFA